MRFAAVLVMCCVGVSCAEERKEGGVHNTPRQGEAAKSDKKRLESVTWDLKSHKLVWVVQTGEPGSNGNFVAKTTERYEISPDDAVMAVKAEKRGFTEQEAASLHKLLDTLSLYCVESVVWWDRGEGDPIDGNGQRVKKKEAPADPGRRHKPNAPAMRTLIGANRGPR
jgi:hypothetical protein